MFGQEGRLITKFEESLYPVCVLPGSSFLLSACLCLCHFLLNPMKGGGKWKKMIFQSNQVSTYWKWYWGLVVNLIWIPKREWGLSFIWQVIFPSHNTLWQVSSATKQQLSSWPESWQASRGHGRERAQVRFYQSRVWGSFVTVFVYCASVHGETFLLPQCWWACSWLQWALPLRWGLRTWRLWPFTWLWSGLWLANWTYGLSLFSKRGGLFMKDFENVKS